MRTQIWGVALAALTLVAPACSENGLLAPNAPPAPRLNHVAGLPSVRISELHYDNTNPTSSGLDIGEFIEISGPAGTDLTGWKVVLYNGSSTQRNPYRTTLLSGV